MKYILYDINKKTLSFIKEEDVLDLMYLFKIRLPTKNDVEKYLKNNNNDPKMVSFFENKTIEEAIQEIKDNISKIENKVPLYDEYTRNLYLIVKEHVYQRVIRQYYRFPTHQLINNLKQRKQKLEKQLKEKEKKKEEIKETKSLEELGTSFSVHYKIKHKELRMKKEHYKLKLMLKFLDQFNMKILETTYVKVFYYNANEVGKNITVCLRPSFLPHFSHINPFYTRSELINMGLNMEIINPDQKYYDESELLKLCNKVKENDISAEVIMQHQIHIIKHCMMGIIQYYTLNGAFFMNQYLRGFTPSNFENPLLEKNIKLIWKLINTAPKFDKSYILYRFISDDPHLRYLKKGDIYTNEAFMSTTRDPFFTAENYQYGYVLLKIKIPKNVEGIALCLETISNFPKEQEIIIPPLTRLKLISKDKMTKYYHINNKKANLVKKRYEFEYYDKLGMDKLELNREPYKGETKLIDFLQIKKKDTITIEEKIRYFVSKYVDPNYQFQTMIGNKVYTIIVEWYNSTSAYKDFYAAKTSRGFSLYTLIDGFIGFMLELGEDNEATYIYANYYYRFSSVPKRGRIDGNDLLEFISKVGYYFEIKNIILFAEYISCDFKTEIDSELDSKKEKNSPDTKIYYGGNHCVDFYRYFKFGEKKNEKFRLNIQILRPGFDYTDLDILKITNPKDILSRNDRDEIYQIYKLTYSKNINKKEDNLSNFYIWLVENYCVYLPFLIKKMNRIFKQMNPFKNDYYVVDSLAYLYNKKLIKTYPVYTDGKTSSPINERSVDNRDSLPRNEYRIRSRNKNSSFE